MQKAFPKNTRLQFQNKVSQSKQSFTRLCTSRGFRLSAIVARLRGPQDRVVIPLRLAYMKLPSILLLSLSLLSSAAMAGGTAEAGIGGALGGVLGSVVGQQMGGSTGSTIGAGLGGAAGSAVGADKRSRGQAAIGGALGAAGGNVLGRSVGGSNGALVGSAAGGGAGGALGNYMGNESNRDDDRRYRGHDDRRDHRGRGHGPRHHWRHR